MPRKVVSVIADDFDGKDLPEDTKPVVLSLERDAYNLYLSDENLGKLREALKPFTDGAEKASATARRSSGSASSGGFTVNTYGYPVAEVRAWAIKNKKKAKSGAPITAATRRINQDIYDAYKAAH